jgi:hypothetical protein
VSPVAWAYLTPVLIMAALVLWLAFLLAADKAAAAVRAARRQREETRQSRARFEAEIAAILRDMAARGEVP